MPIAARAFFRAAHVAKVEVMAKETFPARNLTAQAKAPGQDRRDRLESYLQCSLMQAGALADPAPIAGHDRRCLV